MLLPPNLLPAMEMEEVLMDEVDIGKQFWKDYRKLSVKKDSLRNLLDRFYTKESQLTIVIHGKRIFHTARGIQATRDRNSSGNVRDLSTTVADLDLRRLTSGQVGYLSPEPSGLYSGIEPCGFETWIYVGNLPPNITSRELVELFTQFGRVNEPSISPIRKADGFCFCFVELDSTIAVNQAIKASPLSFKGRQIHVMRRAFNKEKLIYVGNLFPGATIADVEHILKEFGSIRTSNTSIHTQNNGFTFAITELDTVAAAEKAIEASFLRIGNRNISIMRRTSGAPSS